MALEKQYKYKGVTAAYWRIEEINYSKRDNHLACRIFLYANIEAKLACEDLTSFGFVFDAKEYDFKKNLVDFCYKKIKESEMFKDAKDI